MQFISACIASRRFWKLSWQGPQQQQHNHLQNNVVSRLGRWRLKGEPKVGALGDWHILCAAERVSRYYEIAAQHA